LGLVNTGDQTSDLQKIYIHTKCSSQLLRERSHTENLDKVAWESKSAALVCSPKNWDDEMDLAFENFLLASSDSW